MPQNSPESPDSPDLTRPSNRSLTITDARLLVPDDQTNRPRSILAEASLDHKEGEQTIYQADVWAYLPLGPVLSASISPDGPSATATATARDTTIDAKYKGSEPLKGPKTAPPQETKPGQQVEGSPIGFAHTWEETNSDKYAVTAQIPPRNAGKIFDAIISDQRLSRVLPRAMREAKVPSLWAEVLGTPPPTTAAEIGWVSNRSDTPLRDNLSDDESMDKTDRQLDPLVSYIAGRLLMYEEGGVISAGLLPNLTRIGQHLPKRDQFPPNFSLKVAPDGTHVLQIAARNILEESFWGYPFFNPYIGKPQNRVPSDNRTLDLDQLRGWPGMQEIKLSEIDGPVSQRHQVLEMTLVPQFPENIGNPNSCGMVLFTTDYSVAIGITASEKRRPGGAGPKARAVVTDCYVFSPERPLQPWQANLTQQWGDPEMELHRGNSQLAQYLQYYDLI